MANVWFRESKNVEFYEILPEDAEKYVKTVIAFANNQGGTLIIGIKDKTREIVGVDEDNLCIIMDKIANAISDSCEPQIVPSIEPYTVEGKSVIVVTVPVGENRPYYLKSKGMNLGTYIRVGATSRLASSIKIKELLIEGSRKYWDELRCLGYEVTKEAIDKLCKDINEYRTQKRISLGLDVSKLPKVTEMNLLNWKVLKKEEENYVATNAFALLTGDYFRESKIQCGVFKGTSRLEFLDKHDYDGPIYEQINQACSFVLRNIRKSARIEGIIRVEEYELPVDAIREMILNAVCHRNYMDSSSVQVALYDDRLEVTSPGCLYHGLTLDEALQGRSKIRNRAISLVLNQMGLVESWGNGLKNIRTKAKEYGLPDPEFIAMPETFRVNLYRNNKYTKYLEELDIGFDIHRNSIGEASEKHRNSIGEASEKNWNSIGEASEKHRNSIKDVSELDLTYVQRRILEIISKDPKISANKLAELVGISRRNIEANLKKLKTLGILKRVGSPKFGYWEISSIMSL